MVYEHLRRAWADSAASMAQQLPAATAPDPAAATNVRHQLDLAFRHHIADVIRQFPTVWQGLMSHCLALWKHVQPGVA